MATADYNQGQLQDVLALFKRRAWQIVLPGAFGLALGVFFVALLPRSYKVSTQLEVHDVQAPIGGRGFDATAIQRELTKVSTIVKSRDRVRRIVEKQEWDDYLGADPDTQALYVDEVTARLSARTSATDKSMAGSQFVWMDYTDSDPQRAARFLNDVRDSFVQELVARGRDRAKEDLKKLQELRSEKEERYQDMERQLAELRKKYNLSLTQPAPGGGRQRNEDPLYQQLADTRVLLATVQQNLAQEKARNEILHQQYDQTPPELPEQLVAAGVDVQGRIAQIETDIAVRRQDQQGIKSIHSKFKRLESEIQQLEEQRRILLNQSAPPSVDVNYKPNPQRLALALDLQKSDQLLQTLAASERKLAEDERSFASRQQAMADVYREVTNLDTQVESTRTAFLDADQRYQVQKDYFEYVSGPQGNPFQVAARAEPPSEPDSPVVALVVGIFAIAGLALGLISAIVVEFGRNAFRSVGDVTRSMAIPVLGTIQAIVTRQERRNSLVRRAAVGLASVVLIGTILWITWAWDNRQSLLGPRLVDMIEGLRKMLR